MRKLGSIRVRSLQKRKMLPFRGRECSVLCCVCYDIFSACFSKTPSRALTQSVKADSRLAHETLHMYSLNYLIDDYHMKLDFSLACISDMFLLLPLHARKWSSGAAMDEGLGSRISLAPSRPSSLLTCSQTGIPLLFPLLAF